jgi:hypothetical protein
VVGFTQTRLDLGVERTRIGSILHESNGAAEGAGTVERALRAAEHFHPVEIL